ncbi:hypothetical protein N7U49_01490 [Streptomyces sp. AD2-2]|nr:hypothetical protein N7U49_01490 [Streptomyces sp. AD2-2]
MSEVLGASRTVADGAWPWEPAATERRGPRTARRLLSEAWSLSVLTTGLLAGGYAWLGFLVAGTAGALFGAVAGLSTSALLHLLVNRAVSGPRGRRPAGPGLPGRSMARTPGGGSGSVA